ncbi:MAG: formyltransferase family protein, partial [bacterium]|nr:formyltransferase family protein [bacterium]
NLHMGFAPHYRGAIANQFAVLRGDHSRIGATIHYAEEKVDAGKILAVISADATKPPRELFRDLNDRAHARYLEIAEGLFRGEDLPATAQDISRGELFRLRDWNRETRYKLGRKMLQWERSGN